MGKARKPEGETKQQTFIRVATGRVRKCVKDIQQLSRCANKSTYEYTDVQVSQLLGVLEREVEKLDAAFRPQEGSQKSDEFAF